MTPREFRGTQAWKRARALALRGQTHCTLCGGALLLGADPRHPDAPSVDHVIPLARVDLSTPQGRAMAIDQRLLRVAHVGCNAKRGAKSQHGSFVRLEDGRIRSRRW